MDNFKVTIEVEGDKTKMSFSDPAPTFEDLLSGIFSNVLGVMNAAVERAPDEHKEEAKGQLYDCFNMAASRTLELFAPEYELRPGLTAQAILEAENRIIMENRLGEVEEGT